MTRNEVMEVYKDRSSKFTNTQLIQWRANISIWTLLALAINYKNQINLSTTENSDEWKLLPEIGIGLFLLFIHSSFAYKIQKSLEFDKKIKNEIIDQLNKSTNPNESNFVVDLPKEKNKIAGWIILQVSVTLILIIVFLYS